MTSLHPVKKQQDENCEEMKINVVGLLVFYIGLMLIIVQHVIHPTCHKPNHRMMNPLTNMRACVCVCEREKCNPVTQLVEINLQKTTALRWTES